MSKGVIQTALSQKDERPEFDYCQPSVSGHGTAAELGGLTPHALVGYDELWMWDQITYLFRMI